jgi:CRISPR/Cas system type I-B associated protein Csh2 (Cas7 group RAMP superfamily)
MLGGLFGQLYAFLKSMDSGMRVVLCKRFMLDTHPIEMTIIAGDIARDVAHQERRDSKTFVALEHVASSAVFLTIYRKRR